MDLEGQPKIIIKETKRRQLPDGNTEVTYSNERSIILDPNGKFLKRSGVDPKNSEEVRQYIEGLKKESVKRSQILETQPTSPNSVRTRILEKSPEELEAIRIAREEVLKRIRESQIEDEEKAA